MLSLLLLFRDNHSTQIAVLLLRSLAVLFSRTFMNQWNAVSLLQSLDSSMQKIATLCLKGNKRRHHFVACNIMHFKLQLP